jgi:hypothetical protein
MKKLLLLSCLFLISCNEGNKKESNPIGEFNYLYSLSSGEEFSTEVKGWFFLILAGYDEDNKVEDWAKFYVIGTNEEIFYVKVPMKIVRLKLIKEDRPYCKIVGSTTGWCNPNELPKSWTEHIEYVTIYINEKQILNKSIEITL